jgi:copper homeostasis protein
VEPQLEICVERIESAHAARQGGAQRIEVCGALSASGITPSLGLVEHCLELDSIQVMMMIRPHGGGFCYHEYEQQTMLRDIQQAQRLQVHGVVFGALQPDGSIDREFCKRLIAAARPLSITFHRAFDLARDPRQALDDLLELGIDRLLTSGQAATALAGANGLRELVRRAGKELQIVAGGGVRTGQIADLVAATGVHEIHGSASDGGAFSQSDPLGIVHPVRTTQVDVVRAMAIELRQAVDHYRRSPKQ